jgi:V8-like Glu-specific endopeptidase
MRLPGLPDQKLQIMTIPSIHPEVRDILDPHHPRWKLVTAPTSPPFAAICRLAIGFPGGMAQGTGWFAGSRLILTAGHCIFDADHGGWARWVEATFPGGTTMRHDNPERFVSTETWVNREDPQSDIGGIVLSQSAGSGWLRTGGGPIGSGWTVLAAGYPIIANGMWQHDGEVLGRSGRRIFYDVDVDDGQSGAPLLIRDVNGWRAAGLHLHDRDGVPSSVHLPHSCNGGLTIDGPTDAVLAQWGINV